MIRLQQTLAVSASITLGFVMMGSLTTVRGQTSGVPANGPISIEALSRQPALQSVSMSPDGKHIVGLIPSPKNSAETALAVWDTDALADGPEVVTPSGKHMKFIAATALKADKILAITRQEWTGRVTGCGIEGQSIGATRTFLTQVYLTGNDQKDFQKAFVSKRHRAKGVSQRTLTCAKLGSTASLVLMLPLDPDNVLIRRVNENTLVTNYYKYNLKTGKATQTFRASARTSPSLFDARTGKVLAQSGIEPTRSGNDYTQEVYIRDPDSGQFKLQEPLTTKLSTRRAAQVIGRDQQSGEYYVLTNQFSDKAEVRLYDADTHKFEPQPALTDPNYNIAGLIFSTRKANFNQVVGFTVDGPARQQIFIDPTLKKIQATLKQAFDGQQVWIERYTDDFSRILFQTQSASNPPAWHLVRDNKIVNLGSKRPWVAKAGLAINERWVTYTARDGMTIPAILDLPGNWNQGDDAPLSAVVLPHGGPWTREYLGWDGSGWTALLTSRGYAVLRPQYRGSEGLGRKLWMAGDAQWGKKMSNDLDDGAAWLVKQNIARKNRIAIFGYSYGGFAAVAADVRSPSPFQCAIAGAPVANLSKLGTSWSDNRLQRILQGDTVKGMDPMANTNKAHLPILLFNGDRDVRVPPKWNARAFYDAVRHKVSAKHAVIPDMPHSMPWYPRQKKKVDHLIVGFLANDCFGQPDQR